MTAAALLGGASPLTVWNKEAGGAWRRHRIERPCRVRRRTDLGPGREPLAKAAMVFVVPLLESFLMPARWEALEDKSGFFTLKEGDCVAEGLHGHEPGAALTVPELRRLLAGRFAEIRAVHYNTYAPLGAHVKAEGY